MSIEEISPIDTARIEYENQHPIFFIGGMHDIESPDVDSFINEFEQSVRNAIDSAQQGKTIVVQLESTIMDTLAEAVFIKARKNKLSSMEAYQRALFVNGILFIHKINTTTNFETANTLLKDIEASGIYSRNFSEFPLYKKFCQNNLKEPEIVRQNKFASRVFDKVDMLKRHAERKKVQLDVRIEAFPNGHLSNDEYFKKDAEFNAEAELMLMSGDLDASGKKILQILEFEANYNLRREKFLTERVKAFDELDSTSAIILMFGFGHRHIMSQFSGEKDVVLDDPDRKYTQIFDIVKERMMMGGTPNPLIANKIALSGLVEHALLVLEINKERFNDTKFDEIRQTVARCGGISNYLEVLSNDLLSEEMLFTEKKKGWLQRLNFFSRQGRALSKLESFKAYLQDPEVRKSYYLTHLDSDLNLSLIKTFTLIHDIAVNFKTFEKLPPIEG